MNAPRDPVDDVVINSSGNVFNDLGLNLSEEEMVKIQIARAIGNTIQKLGLTQTDAAKRIGTDQSKVSAVLRGRLDSFSAERLLRFLLLLGRDVDIHVSRQTRAHESGRIRVRAA
jgi:predicted XRE-type DNA-binding protein